MKTRQCQTAVRISRTSAGLTSETGWRSMRGKAYRSTLRHRTARATAARAPAAGTSRAHMRRRRLTRTSCAATTTSGDPGQRAHRGACDVNPCPVCLPSTRPPSPLGGREGKNRGALCALPLAALSAAREDDAGPTRSIHQRQRRPTLDEGRRTTKRRQSTPACGPARSSPPRGQPRDRNTPRIENPDLGHPNPREPRDISPVSTDTYCDTRKPSGPAPRLSE